jgi:hypothetical protein
MTTSKYQSTSDIIYPKPYVLGRQPVKLMKVKSRPVRDNNRLVGVLHPGDFLGDRIKHIPLLPHGIFCGIVPFEVAFRYIRLEHETSNDVLSSLPLHGSRVGARANSLGLYIDATFPSSFPK